MTTETVTVEKLVYGGDGLCRLPSGEIMLVPFAAPGDTMAVSVAERKKRVLQGQIEQLQAPAVERVTPPCSVFGTCGGCHWQHLSIEAQQDWKRRIVAESLERIGKLSGITVEPTLAAPEGENQWNYRNTVQWHVDASGQLGYTRFHSHDVVPFDHCWIIPPALNDLAQWLQTQPLQGIRKIEARLNGSGQILVSLAGNTPAKDWLSLLPEAFASVTGVVWNDTCVFGEPYLLETVGDRVFQVSTHSFFQVNPFVLPVMLGVLDAMLPEETASLADVYAGVGLFSLWRHRQSGSVLAVESSPSAINDMKANCARKDAHNVTIYPGAVEQVLPALSETVETAIVDPPRSGCHSAVITWLNTQVTRQVIYISCDPTTLARDLKLLTEAGWRIDRVQPLDMFPQTYHIETMVSLSR